MDQTRQRKQELSQQLHQQRQQLSVAQDRVSRELSVGYQLKKSVGRQPVAWFAGSLGAGTLVSMIFSRGTVVQEKSRKKGIIRWTLGAAFGLAKPLLMKWALEKAQERILPEIAHRLRNQPGNFR